MASHHGKEKKSMSSPPLQQALCSPISAPMYEIEYELLQK